MSTKINITIESTGMTAEQANNLATFLGSLKEEVKIENEKEVPTAAFLTQAEETEKPKATRQRSKKVEVIDSTEQEQAEAKEIEVIAPEVLKVEIEEEDLNDETTIKIEDIRKLVAEKQAVHKDLLRAKLKEYGSANVTALPVQHYKSFYDLLVSLK